MKDSDLRSCHGRDRIQIGENAPFVGQVFSDQNFREEWEKACVKVGLGAWTCKASGTACAHLHCPSRKKRVRCTYSGLTFHDFGRSAVCNLADIGVREKVAMSTSGTKIARCATAITS